VFETTLSYDHGQLAAAIEQVIVVAKSVVTESALVAFFVVVFSYPRRQSSILSDLGCSRKL